MLKTLLFALLGLVVAFAAYVFMQGPLRSPKENLGQDRPYDLRVGTRFIGAQGDGPIEATFRQLELPLFPGANSIWGATGRDDRGHIWIGVSVQGEAAARLIEYIPAKNMFVDHGDPLTALKSAGLYREGETQRKIHSKIIQADDGYLYFSSMDEEGESGDGSRLPTWGSHLWRYDPKERRWEHVFKAPEGLVAVSGVGRWIYALGYWDHVLYQYDTHTGEVASVRVGSAGGHVSRNFVVDVYGNAYVPRAEWVGESLFASLVQFNTALQEVASTPLTQYAGTGKPARHHGITGLSYLADNSIVIVTGHGYAYRIVPSERNQAVIEELGWFHPEGRSYTATLFPLDGKTKLLGVGQSKRRGSGHALVEYDIAQRSSRVIELDIPDLEYLLLYGSNTRDDSGKLYVVGRHSWDKPLVWQLDLESQTSEVKTAQGSKTVLDTSSPIAESIGFGDISLQLEDVAQIPADGSTPKTRINYLYHANDGSGRLFVNDMRGQIYIIEDGQLLPDPFLNLAEVIGAKFLAEEFELGLGSFAFHPDFARAGAEGFGKVYTLHTESKSSIPYAPAVRILRGTERAIHHFDVITEWSVSATDADEIDPATRREVLRIAQPWWDHNAGQLAFNPKPKPGASDYGLLYIGVGDGGNTANRNLEIDADQQGQDLSSPLGKILRIDPLRRGSEPYTIPQNPFVKKGDALGEVWAYGLRNPQRFSWDTGGDGKMLIGDIGQDRIEEVNLGRKGGNYQWGINEGTLAVYPSRLSELERARGRSMGPVLQYDHDEGQAIAGGFVYRGRAIPELRGMYVFGDIVKGRVFYAKADDLANDKKAEIRELGLVHNGAHTSLLEIMGHSPRADLRFGMDQDGELYVLTKQDGWVRKLTAAPGAPVAVQSEDASASSAPLRENLPGEEQSGEDRGWTVAVVVAAGAGVAVLLVTVVVLLRGRERGVVAARTSESHGGAVRYASTRDNHAIEVVAEDQVVKLTGYDIGGVREVDYADISGFDVNVNERTILSVSREAKDDFCSETIPQLRTQLLEVQKERMAPTSVRRIDLSIRCESEPSLVHTLNFYFRQGNRRMTPHSYENTVEDVVYWCELMASILSSPPVESVPPGALAETSSPVAVEKESVDTGTTEQTVQEPQRESETSGLDVPSLADELDKLVRLLDQGFLTEDEFQKAKQKLLGG